MFKIKTNKMAYKEKIFVEIEYIQELETKIIELQNLISWTMNFASRLVGIIIGSIELALAANFCIRMFV